MQLYNLIDIKNNINLYLIILIIILYHHGVLNYLEKMFCELFLNYDFIKRPLLKCEEKENMTFRCLGMPSGHAETITIFALLLYNYKIISFQLSMLLIILVSLQRVFVKAHTFLQVIIGILLGCIYSCIYISNNLSYKCLFYILGITFVIIFSIIYKIELEVYKPIPNCLDKSIN